MSCVVSGCKNRRSINNVGIAYHRFPRDETLKEEWIKALKASQKDNWHPLKNSIVCSKHFKESDIEQISLKKGTLKKNAVPSIFNTIPKQKIYQVRRSETIPSKGRKVLMNEAQVKRLEAAFSKELKSHEGGLGKKKEDNIIILPNILYKEQNGLSKLSKLKEPKPKDTVIAACSMIEQPVAENQTETEFLNALMETVYQRRELKTAGAKVSIPNKGGYTRLGDLSKVTSLVVAASYKDLDVLHHLIYKTEANVSRVRKNILDFGGFNFTEESLPYQDRMKFLTSLGYDISRRIAFLLGLCPYETLISQQDLNELIMYFLMSPCQPNQVPMEHLQTSSFEKDMPVELEKAQSDSEPRARKSFKSSVSSYKRRVPLSEGSTSELRARKTFKSSFTSSTKKSRPSVLQPPVQPPPTTSVQKPLEMGILKTQLPKGSALKEFYVQQNGQRKAFKFIELPSNHPLNTVSETQVSQSLPKVAPDMQSIAIAAPVIGAPGLHPGAIVFKNYPTNPALSRVMQTVPLAIGQSTPKIIDHMVVQSTPGIKPLQLPRLVDNSPGVISKATEEPTAENLVDDQDLTMHVECSYIKEEVEELCPLEDGNSPTVSANPDLSLAL